MRMHYQATLAFCVWVAISLASFAQENVSFNRDIRPIFSGRCFQCHGPDENTREADLRLDIAEGDQGPFVDRDGSFVIRPKSLERSELWARITTSDEDLLMPPQDSHKEPLNTEERELVRKWILQGAEYQDFWAFTSPQSQTPPTVSHKQWNHTRIDRFVYDRIQAEGLQPQPTADRRTLIRRLSFDLTGLPPTREEINTFVGDESPDAYEVLVDNLLSSPRYGEHMAKYWLDLVRFADTNGIHHDHYREMTPYRDWVIRSFNGNLRFNDFVTYQVAGDLFEEPTLDQQIASGFNRLHLVIDVGTAIPEESFNRNVVDRVTAFGTAFMGMTVGCAVCHDHKYDPITQKDFYQLYAFFNNLDSTPETPGRGLHAPFVRLPSKDQATRLSEFDKKIVATKAAVLALKLKDPDDKLEDAESEVEKLKKQRKLIEDAIPVSLVMKERTQVRPTYILNRGAYDDPGEEVQRDTPAFLPPLESENEIKSRMDLARWLTKPSHPLTARVTVNRLWQQFFGVGLVKTSEDFGAQGETPSHPELLDDLSQRFVASGWNVKSLVKEIVMSRTYQQSSTASKNAYLADPDNRLLARGARFRLDAEMVRDQILYVGGLLNEEMFGKSVKPPQPPDLWKNVSMRSSSTYAFKADTGDKIYRRSLYSFWKRALPPPQMTIFDAPTREACTARRERTNTPLQALVLMNETQYFHAAKQFASKLIRDYPDDEKRVRVAYESITGHPPDDRETRELRSNLNEFRHAYTNSPELAKELAGDDDNEVQLAAHTMLVNALFNLDVTKTRQ